MRSNSFEASTFKLKAKESCHEEIIKGIVMYTDSRGGQKSVPIESFEISHIITTKSLEETSAYMSYNVSDSVLFRINEIAEGLTAYDDISDEFHFL